MNVKKNVQILGLKIKVQIAPSLRDDQGNLLFGYYDANKREIWLSADQDEDTMVRTFLHEFGHAFLDRIGIRVALSPEIQEVIVEGFSNVLHENFYRKSPKRRSKG